MGSPNGTFSMPASLYVSNGCVQCGEFLELNMLKERLEKLETEFARLQSTVENTAVAPSSEKMSSQSSENLMLALPGSLPPQPPEPPASPPPPPHPPPPPLPPPRPPPAPLCLKRTGGAKTQADSLKTDVPVQITLQDLLNVKLKKTQSSVGVDKLQKGLPFEKRKALITLSDLQSVNLKSKAPRPPAHIISHLITPSRSGLDFRKHLKKVAIERSPGGTPLTNKENIETGTGLTPIMTQALRRKFQLAHPKSPSPARLPTGSSFEEYS